MIDITTEQITAARGNDIDAVRAIIDAFEPRVLAHARSAASRGGRLDADLMEDLAQVGRLAEWEALSRFEGDTVAEFFAYVDRTISGAIADERRRQTRAGVAKDVAYAFETALTMAGGDPYEAEQIACGEALGRRKLSREMAYAARLAWQGTDTLDMPQPAARRGVSHDGEGARPLYEIIPDPSTVEDPRDADSDRAAARRAEIRGYVHTALGKLSAKADSILRGTYGISGPTPYYGTEHEEEFANALGITRNNLSTSRKLAKDRFRVVYLAGEATTA